MNGRRSISTILVAVVVIVIIIIAAAAVYLASQGGGTSSSLTSTTSSSSSSILQSSSSSVMSSSSTSPSTTGTNSSTVPSSGSQLVIDEPQFPDTLDVAVSATPSGQDVSVLANLGLFLVNASATSQLIPVLGTSYTQSANGLTYTISLRNGVYYSNGDPFNAYVLWWNVYRDLIINQPDDSEYFLYFNSSGVTAGDLNSLNNPQNAPNSTLMQIMQNPHLSATVLNTSAIQFNLAAPFPSFMSSLTVVPWNFVDPYTVSQHGGVVANHPNTWMSINGSNVGDGPYIVSQVVSGQYLTMIENPHYWAQNLTGNIALRPGHIPMLVFNYKADELTRELDLETNKAQIAMISYPDVKHVMNTDPNVLVPQTGPTGLVEWLTLNSRKAPLNNTLLRKAIVEAINVTQIQQSAFGGYAVSFVGPMPSGFPLYNNSIKPPLYNVSDAKKLLTEAGYPNGQGLPTLKFLYATSPYTTLVDQILISDLAQLGITVSGQGSTINTFESIDYSNTFNSTTAPDIIESPWAWWPDFSGYGYLVDDALGFLFEFHNQTVNNFVAAANSQINATRRAYDISQVALLTQQSYAFIWLAQYTNTFNPGTFTGTFVWNKCDVSGLWYSPSWFGVPYNSIRYSC